jgi:hypothetical protein
MTIRFSFAPFAFFAGDIPRPTGARSAPYENLRVLRAFVVNPTFLILVAVRRAESFGAVPSGRPVRGLFLEAFAD